jgi:DNA-binding beta-propeller fold protein YncE
MSFLDFGSDSVYQGAVTGADGWVFPNDMKIVGAQGYVAVNGTDRIDVIDLVGRTVSHSIPFPSGRGPGFLAVGGDTLYVANYDGSVCLVALGMDSVVGTVEHVVGFPGGIAIAGGKVFVSDIGLYPEQGRWVRVLRPGAPIGRDSVRVENSPGAVTEQSGSIFVVCTGTSRLYRIDPETLLLEDSLQLGGYLSDMAGDGESLYVLGADSVAKVEDNPLSIISSGLIRRTAGSFFYALGVRRPEGTIYVSNIMTLGGSGRVEVYHADGSQARVPFPVGVFPGAFAFRP